MNQHMKRRAPIYDFISLGKLKQSDVKSLREISNELLDADQDRVNQDLAGHVHASYELPKESYQYQDRGLKQLQMMTKHREWKLTENWVNFQRKNEYNPFHRHSGEYSYVIWLTIPYNMKEELDVPNVKNSSTPCPTAFTLYYTDPVGQIQTEDFFPEKEDAGSFVIFPSNMCHSVHPFYTSDEYRVSISGNLVAV